MVRVKFRGAKWSALRGLSVGRRRVAVEVGGTVRKIFNKKYLRKKIRRRIAVLKNLGWYLCGVDQGIEGGFGSAK